MTKQPLSIDLTLMMTVLPSLLLTPTEMDLLLDGNGGIELKDANGVVVYPFNGDYGSGFSVEFDSNGVLWLGDNDFATSSIIS